MGIRQFLCGGVKDDMSVTYVGGMSVRRVQRGRKVEWLVDGRPVDEATAKECMRNKERELRAKRP